MFPDPQTAVVGFIAIGNSAALLDGLFLEGSLGFTVVRLTQCRVFVVDTRNRLPDAIAKLKLPQEPRSTLSLLWHSARVARAFSRRPASPQPEFLFVRLQWRVDYSQQLAQPCAQQTHGLVCEESSIALVTPGKASPACWLTDKSQTLPPTADNPGYP